jgi:hypothetical protein
MFGLPQRHPSRTPLREFSPGHFMELAEFKNVMSRATTRCSALAESEKILGYEENWRVYTDMAKEITYLYTWYQKVLP